MTTWFDAPTLAAYVRAKRGQRGLREVAAEIGTVSPSTLSRMERGAVSDIETFLRICDWLQMPTSAFIHSPTSTHNRSGSEESAHLVEQALCVDGILSPQVISAFVILLHAVRTPRTPQAILRFRNDSTLLGRNLRPNLSHWA